MSAKMKKQPVAETDQSSSTDSEDLIQFLDNTRAYFAQKSTGERVLKRVMLLIFVFFIGVVLLMWAKVDASFSMSGYINNQNLDRYKTDSRPYQKFQLDNKVKGLVMQDTGEENAIVSVMIGAGYLHEVHPDSNKTYTEKNSPVGTARVFSKIFWELGNKYAENDPTGNLMEVKWKNITQFYSAETTDKISGDHIQLTAKFHYRGMDAIIDQLRRTLTNFAPYNCKDPDLLNATVTKLDQEYSNYLKTTQGRITLMKQLATNKNSVYARRTYPEKDKILKDKASLEAFGIDMCYFIQRNLIGNNIGITVYSKDGIQTMRNKF